MMRYQLVDKITNEIVTPHYVRLAPNGELYMDGMNVTGRYHMRIYTECNSVDGVEIHEGDIVKGPYWERGEKHRFIGQVMYRGAAFKVVGVKQYYGMDKELHPLYEVIGNIYTSPELLESKS